MKWSTWRDEHSTGILDELDVFMTVVASRRMHDVEVKLCGSWGQWSGKWRYIEKPVQLGGFVSRSHTTPKHCHDRISTCVCSWIWNYWSRVSILQGLWFLLVAHRILLHTTSLTVKVGLRIHWKMLQVIVLRSCLLHVACLALVSCLSQGNPGGDQRFYKKADWAILGSLVVHVKSKQQFPCFYDMRHSWYRELSSHDVLFGDKPCSLIDEVEMGL